MHYNIISKSTNFHQIIYCQKHFKFHIVPLSESNVSNIVCSADRKL